MTYIMTIILAYFIYIAIFTAGVLLLWNVLIASIFTVATLSIWQALVIAVIVIILKRTFL